MRYITRLVVAGLMTCGVVTSAASQDAAAEPTLADSSIAGFVGEWEGKGVYQRGPGQSEEVWVTEEAEWAFGQKAILVEGRGVATDEDGVEKVVHDAIGVIRLDSETGKVMMHAFTPDQQPVVTEMHELDDGSLRWGFDPGPGQTVRFTITFTETTWKEVGEFSPDGGKNWYGFFEMNLMKIADRDDEDGED